MSDEKPRCPGKKTLVINKGAVDEYTDEKPCRWPIPMNINVRVDTTESVKDSHVSFDCPECGTSILCLLKAQEG